MNKLMQIQSELNAPKTQRNNFGGYMYRSCEDILTAVKPLLLKYECSLLLSDEMIEIGGRVYVRAMAIFSDGEKETRATANAREAVDQKGMQDAQITGSASSYARKYALNGLFLIDDTKDADSTNTHGKEEPKVEHKDADPAFIAKREAEKAKMRQTMQTVLETKPTASQTPKTASGDIATGLIMYANPKNAGGFRSYALENYQRENGKDLMFSTRDTTMIETLDDRLAKEQKVSFRFVPNENPNFAANIVELIAVE